MIHSQMNERAQFALTEALAKVERTTKAILAKALRGEMITEQ